MNDYYDIAIDDMEFLVNTDTKGKYNQVSFHCHQVCEKLLKSILVLVDVNAKGLLNSHSLKTILRRLHNEYILSNIDIRDMADLTDVYFETRYHGDEYYLVTESDFKRYLELTKNVLFEVNLYRESLSLPTVDLNTKSEQFDCNGIFTKYRERYSIIDDEEWFDELKRLSKLAGSSDLNILAKYILDNFL